MKVLIVEDEFRIREGLEKLTARLSSDYEVVGTAENGVQGLELIRSKRPDIVITDIRMPEMDGLEMITRAVEEKLPVKVIVLSAYSEFDYARRAMKLGVTEYLLKPLSFGDFSQAMKNVTAQVDAEKKRKPAEIGTISQMFSDIINRRIELSDDIKKYLSNTYGVENDGKFILVCLYLGNDYDASAETAKSDFSKFLASYRTQDELKFTLAECGSKQAVVAVVYRCADFEDLKKWMMTALSQFPLERASIVWNVASGIDTLAAELDRMYPYMDWNISFECGKLILYPEITKVKTDSCIYPILLDSKVKTAVAESKWDVAREVMADFHKCFRDGHVYVPKEIKECYVRFLWVVIAMAKEIGNANAKKVEQQALLNMIMSAKVREELEDASESLFKTLEGNPGEDDELLLIKKAKRYVTENLRQGVTLDVIGSKLNVTPEYLGTLFKKETGISFSTYLRNVRVERAKELLCTTDMKTYEISEAVGYSDTKYFSKVFREVTGLLPRAYRNTVK
ncbi:MAG: response regulator [Treponema sp.]|nr:response regulator [Candidatus Treponema caballi]